MPPPRAPRPLRRAGPDRLPSLPGARRTLYIQVRARTPPKHKPPFRTQPGPVVSPTDPLLRFVFEPTAASAARVAPGTLHPGGDQPTIKPVLPSDSTAHRTTHLDEKEARAATLRTVSRGLNKAPQGRRAPAARKSRGGAAHARRSSARASTDPDRRRAGSRPTPKHALLQGGQRLAHRAGEERVSGL